MLLVSCVSATIFEQMCTEVYAGSFNDGWRPFNCLLLHDARVVVRSRDDSDEFDYLRRTRVYIMRRTSK